MHRSCEEAEKGEIELSIKNCWGPAIRNRGTMVRGPGSAHSGSLGTSNCTAPDLKGASYHHILPLPRST